MYGKIKEYLQQELDAIKAAGLYKTERIIESPQRAEIDVAGKKVLNFCANNYLGLSDNPRLIEAAKKAMDERGFGMSSVRFICGCQDMHKELEKAIAKAQEKTDRRTWLIRTAISVGASLLAAVLSTLLCALWLV